MTTIRRRLKVLWPWALGMLVVSSCAPSGTALTPLPPQVAEEAMPAQAPPLEVTGQSPPIPEEVSWTERRLRDYAEEDDVDVERVRLPTAVLLFAPPPRAVTLSPMGLQQLEPIRFQPLLCSIDGQLAVGKRCGEAMPVEAVVRSTSDHGEPGIRARRSTTPFVDEAGGRTYPAPTGPACCMYNTCIGETIPYFATPTTKEGAPLVQTQTILGVWPLNADVALETHGPYVGDEETFEGLVWPVREPKLVQVVTIDGLRFVSATGGSTESLLFVDTPGGWLSFGERSAREHHIIASTDVDGDGHREVIVLTQWANDYGLAVYPAGAAEPIYSFSCGNV